MAETETTPALLEVAVQDLYAGKRLLSERLPALVEVIDDANFGSIASEMVDDTEQQAERLRNCDVDVEGLENLWMSGILDDADRDSRSVARGPLLDIALIGAIRKAKAAEIVSEDTAIMLASRLGNDAVKRAVETNRADDSRSDGALRARLEALAAQA